MKLSKIIATSVAAIVAASSLAAVASAESYNGYIGFQTGAYSFRNNWTESSYGKATDYFNSAIVWGDDDTNPDTYGDDYCDYFDYDVNGYVVPVTFTDTAIAGDGTYTVGVEGFDWSLDGVNFFNFLNFNTDIPFEMDETVKFTDAKIIIDGEVAATVDAVTEDKDGYILVNFINVYNTEVAKYDGAYPTSTLQLEVTISGLGSADVAADETIAEPIDTTTVVDTAAPTTDSKGNADTGVEGVAAIAGLAVVATVAAIVAKKRK